MYMLLVLFASMAMSDTPSTGSWSVLDVHVFPPFVVFHKPPAGAPAHTILLLVGSKRMQFILPTPPSVGTELTGPSSVQLAAVNCWLPPCRMASCCCFHCC